MKISIYIIFCLGLEIYLFMEEKNQLIHVYVKVRKLHIYKVFQTDITDGLLGQKIRHLIG